MSYLFDGGIESAIKVEAMRGNATHLKGVCERTTQSLIASDGREFNSHNDFEAAEQLVKSMGVKTKPAVGRWYGEFVHNWRQVSDNIGTIKGMVLSELGTAYQIGLDIQSANVIGHMFDLAVQVWSTIGEYTGPSQNEGRR
jgi:hypothetical protein